MKRIAKDNCLLCHNDGSIFDKNGAIRFPSLRFRIANILTKTEAAPKGMETVVDELNTEMAKPENRELRDLMQRWIRETRPVGRD